MTAFSSKKINSLPSVGEMLKEARAAKHISLQQAARDTKVSVDYLDALENNDYNSLPGDVYARSFLKVYSKYLGLDVQKATSNYVSERNIVSKTSNIENVADRKKPVEKVFWSNLLVTPKIIRGLIIFALVVVCMSYLGFKVRSIITPPILEISVPEANMVTTDKVIEVVGNVEPGANLRINGQPVLSADDGSFSEDLILREGTNIIEIVAQKKHGKQSIIYRQVIVTKEDSI